MKKIFEEIAAERQQQNEKWGEQNFPMTTDGAYLLDKMLKSCREINESDFVDWYSILMEEVCESFLESEPEKQREEMIQVAAVAVQIIEYLDRKIKEMSKEIENEQYILQN